MINMLANEVTTATPIMIAAAATSTIAIWSIVTLVVCISIDIAIEGSGILAVTFSPEIPDIFDDEISADLQAELESLYGDEGE